LFNRSQVNGGVRRLSCNLAPLHAFTLRFGYTIRTTDNSFFHIGFETPWNIIFFFS
jgi:hypothetical protein